jgi:hypothetical protein
MIFTYVKNGQRKRLLCGAEQPPSNLSGERIKLTS